MVKLYLKPQVIIEPLICKWYAWLHLLSPLTAGHHFEKRYKKILISYREHKELHQEAVKTAKLAGGFFANLDESQNGQVESLFQQMEGDLGQLIGAAKKVDFVNEMLVNVEKGYSLESLYKHVPDELRGAVELVYDCNDSPTARFIEPVLYELFYSTKLQSVFLSEYGGSRRRPFVTSTPRLAKQGEVDIPLPFSSKALDQLVASREAGIEWDVLIGALGISDAGAISLRELFTEEEPCISSDREYTGEGVRIRYFGHACVLLQTSQTSILIDPFVCNHGGQKNCYSYFDLPEIIDVVLITHAHQDHLVLETLLQIRARVKQVIVPRNSGGFIFDPSMKIMLNKIGFNAVSCIEEFESLQIGSVTIQGIPFLGEHGDLNVQSKIAYSIKAEEQSFLFAVDSNNIAPELYHIMRKMLGSIDYVFIGMECKGAPFSWTYGPLSPRPIPYKHDQSRRLSGSDCEKAWNLVSALGARHAYVYAMGLESWFSYLLGVADDPKSLPITESDSFVKKCRENGIVSARLFQKEECIYKKEQVEV